MSQTLKVSSGWLRRVKLALERHFSTQKAFAIELGLSTRRVSDFFNGRPIDAESFKRICQKLELEWQKVAKVSAKALELMPIEAEVKSSATVTTATATTTTAPEEIAAVPQGGASIPRLASHLFKNFNAPGHVDTLPRKKFVPVSNVAPPVDMDDADEDMTDSAQPMASVDFVDEDATDSAQSMTSVDFVEPKSNLNSNVGDAIASARQPEDPLDALKAVLNELRAEKEPVAPVPLPAESFKARTLDRIGDRNENDIKVPKALENTEDEDEVLSDLADSDPDSFSDEVTAITLKVIVPQPTREAEDTKALLKLYRDACAIGDWDTASEVIRYADWHYLKEIGELQLILELHEQLLPSNWRSGGRKVSDLYRHWQILHNSGGACYYLGDFAAAVELYETALALIPQLDRPDLELTVLYGLGLANQALGQAQTAIKYFQQYLMRAIEQQDDRAQTTALCNLGNIYYALRQYRTAISYYHKFLSAMTQSDFVPNVFGSLVSEINILGNLGSAYYKLGDYQAAINYQQRYLEIAKDSGHREREAIALISLGFAYSALGLEQTALEHQQQALNLARQLRNHRLQVSALKGLGHSYRDLANYRMAISCYQQSLEIARQIGDRDAQVQAMYSLRKLHGTLLRAN
ncbi:MAG: helix-turn-helix transcriptional regulator [Pseudanabaena sp. CRU_2_10]|nr:helix-turn-helix transcriptional regulator [Pseudanabaena sp. CRU_2_10]